VEIAGFCEPRFQPLKDALRANFDEGLEVGASLALTHEGRTVVDLWGGHADWGRTLPWERDTIVQVYSVTKVPTVFSFLMLVGRGLVDLDTPVAAYWPEFAAGGKAHVTVRQALSHRAGVPGFVPPVTFETLHDWEATVGNIAEQAHWFDGEDRFCYHATTYGYILGEIMRRTDGRGPAQFFREEIAKKAGVDFHIGLRSRDDWRRVAQVGYLKPPQWGADVDPVSMRVMSSVGDGDWGTWERTRAEIPATNGYTNARAIARLCAIGALHGELDGVRYVSPEIMDRALRVEVYSVDLLFGPLNMGLGFGLHSHGFPAPTPTAAHWGGFGGSLSLMDPATKVGFGYAMNNLILAEEYQGEARFHRIWSALGEVMSGL
jgi:CubicO group peptidase (beta-lactamase class C family)